jgi:sugar lactone lactonase YvrE
MFVSFAVSFLVDSMSVDTDGNIYILDSNQARVTKWEPSATTGILVAGGPDFSNYYGDYYSYYGGYYYSYNYYGYYYGYYGAYYSDYYENYNNQIYGPFGMFIEEETMIIWVADTYNSQITKWPNSSTRIYVCGSYGSGSDQFMNPQGLFIDTNAGNIIYVADTNNHRIQMWLPGANNGITVAGLTNYYGNGLNQLWYPKTLIVDTNGYMFIVDTTNCRILKWMIGASSGMIIAGSGTCGAGMDQLDAPYSISFDSSGSIFVSDSANNRVQKFAISCSKNYLLLLISFLRIFFYCIAAMNMSTTTTPSIVTIASK